MYGVYITIFASLVTVSCSLMTVFVAIRAKHSKELR